MVAPENTDTLLMNLDDTFYSINKDFHNQFNQFSDMVEIKRNITQLKSSLVYFDIAPH